MTSLPKIIAYCRSLKLRNPTVDPTPGAPLHGSEQLGAQLAEGFQAVQHELEAIKTQGNFSGSGQPAAPPNLDGFNVSTGPSGEFQFAITHNAEISRGINYTVNWADNPHFTNSHNINLGDSRNHSELYLPEQTIYSRALAAYPSGLSTPWAYHGSATNPIPVTGGIIGQRAASQGSGTGAPGDGGGPGPVPARTATCGYPWKAQRAQGGVGFPQAGITPAGAAAFAPAPSGGGGGAVVSALIIVDVYANWTSAKNPPANYPVGTLFVISDRNNLTYQVQTVSSASTWVYYEGTYSVTQSTISSIKGYNATSLGVNDTGLQIRVTDYEHVLAWSGSAWTWGAGESGSGYFSDFAVAPNGSGWHACDGSSGIKYLKADGTTGTVTLPNTASTPAYRKSAGSYSATISSAATPTVTIGSITPSGTISAPTLTMNSYTPAGSVTGAVGTPIFTGTPAALTTNLFTPVALATAALTSLGGSTSSYTPSGSVSTPAFVGSFSGAPATLTGTVSAPTLTGTPVTPTGTISLAGGDPVANYQAITYFRQ